MIKLSSVLSFEDRSHFDNTDMHSCYDTDKYRNTTVMHYELRGLSWQCNLSLISPHLLDISVVIDFFFVIFTFCMKTALLGRHSMVQYIPTKFDQGRFVPMDVHQGSKLRGAEGQNAPKLSPNAPRLLNLGAKFCYPIQPDICFEA